MKINSNNEHEIKDNIMFMIEHTSMKSTEATNLKHFIPFMTGWGQAGHPQQESEGVQVGRVACAGESTSSASIKS